MSDEPKSEVGYGSKSDAQVSAPSTFESNPTQFAAPLPPHLPAQHTSAPH